MNLNYVIITGAAEERLKSIPSDSVDFILTSPPYDDVRDYEGYTFNFAVFRKIARQLYRVLKSGGTLIWVVGDQTKKFQETGTSFRQALYFRDTVGFLLHDTMIYERKGPPLTHNRYEQSFEYMFCLTKGRPKTFNGLREPKEYPEKKARVKNWSRWSDGSFKQGEIKVSTDTRLRYNVFRYPMGHVSKEKFAHEHPAIFPEDLAYDQIHSWSNFGDVVLDPFCGSGTTAKVALSMGRKFIGIEISPKYVELTKRRIQWNRNNRQGAEEQCVSA